MLLSLLLLQTSAHISLKLESKPTSLLTNHLKSNELSNRGEVLYSTPVKIGNPGSTFNLIIDTYLSTTWVSNKNCSTCTSFPHHYNPSKSGTFRDLHIKTSGEISNFCFYLGNIASDFITLRGFDSVVSARFNFTLVSSTQKCAIDRADGGLSLQGIESYKPTPFVVVLKENREISSAVFAIFINSLAGQGKETIPSPSLEIGGFNLTLHSSDPSALFYLKNDGDEGKWGVTFESVHFGMWTGGNTLVYFSSTQKFITGDINAYIDFIPYLSIMGFECTQYPKNMIIKCKKSKKFDYPSFTFTFQNFSVSLSSKSIWDCEESQCTLMIEFTSSGYWTFGQVFMENYFTIFNYDNNSIGFAPAAKSHAIESDDSSFSRLVSLIWFLIISLVS